jgi:hypothetical protein
MKMMRVEKYIYKRHVFAIMMPVLYSPFVRNFRFPSLLRWTLAFCAVVFTAPNVIAEQSERPAYNNIRTANRAFQIGERLQYAISWSGLLEAGTVVMEVKAGKTPEGRNAVQFISTARSKGIVTAFYPVSDTVTSLVDGEDLCSIAYVFDQKHGRKKKQRILFFDQDARKVRYVSAGAEGIFEVPYRVQDALSSLYYLRTRDDIKAGVPLHIDVFDSGKSWSVEIRIHGKERIKTDLGEFDTIKVSTYPKYEGVFQHKGEIIMWLTDDARKVPVLMKSKISIGSIVGTLTEMKER